MFTDSAGVNAMELSVRSDPAHTNIALSTPDDVKCFVNAEEVVGWMMTVLDSKEVDCVSGECVSG